MKEYFCLTDIHSFYDNMIDALNKKGFDINNPEHIVITCGDNMDRGPDSDSVLDFLYKLFKENRVHLVKGNHEDLFQQMIRNGNYGYHDDINGTLKTLGHLQKPREEDGRYNFDFNLRNYDKRWDELMSAMVNYYETPNHVFVHGWIPFKKDKWKNQVLYDPDWRNADNNAWYEARWVNGMRYAKEYNIVDHEKGKTIICGHWHCSYGNVREIYPEKTYGFYRQEEFVLDKNYFDPYYNKELGIIAFDACTALTGICNCLHFTEEDI